MKQPTLPFVIVEWNDAVTWDTPISIEDVSVCHRPEVVYTLGWVLKEDERGISLATEYYDEQFRGRSFIDRAMIKSVTPYKLTRQRKNNEKTLSNLFTAPISSG